MAPRRTQRDNQGRLVVPDLTLPARPPVGAQAGQAGSTPAQQTNQQSQQPREGHQPSTSNVPVESPPTNQRTSGSLPPPGAGLPPRPQFGSSLPPPHPSLPSRPDLPQANMAHGNMAHGNMAHGNMSQGYGGHGFSGMSSYHGQYQQSGVAVAMPHHPAGHSFHPGGSGYGPIPPHPSQKPSVGSGSGRGRGNTKNTNAKVPAAAQGASSHPQPSDEVHPEQNCSTWWTGLPANCTYPMLFDSMRGIGAIHMAHVYLPSGNHSTASAKVDFFDRASVDRLFRQQQRGGQNQNQILVGGVRPNITHNRRRAGPTPIMGDPLAGDGAGAGATRLSRVLMLVGDPHVINTARLNSLFFDEYFIRRDTEYVREQALPDGRNEVVVAFASYSDQAIRALQAILVESIRPGGPDAQLWAGVQWTFRADPCE